MILEKQYFGVTKKLWLEVELNDDGSNGVGKQPVDYKDKLSMDNIHLEYKQDLNVKDNNFAFKQMTVPFTDQQWIDLQLNNYVIYEPTGEPVEIVDIEYFDKKYQANISILLPDGSAFNTQTIKLA